MHVNSLESISELALRTMGFEIILCNTSYPTAGKSWLRVLDDLWQVDVPFYR
jgi:hypothetical protein